jgi:hypothetical protein
MSINASMAVIGYYHVSSTETRGFVRNQDGDITTSASGTACGYLDEFNK